MLTWPDLAFLGWLGFGILKLPMDSQHEQHHPLDPGYRFCPKCGHELEKRLIKAGEPERLVCKFCGFIFYLDSKVAVGTIPILQGRFVLLRRAISPGYGKWVFPGGFVDPGETLEAAAVRETMEEVNLKVRPAGILNVYSYPGRPVIVIVYRVEILGGELKAGDEALEVAAFAPAQIPWKELAFPSTRDALRDFLGGMEAPKIHGFKDPEV